MSHEHPALSCPDLGLSDDDIGYLLCLRRHLLLECRSPEVATSALKAASNAISPGSADSITLTRATDKFRLFNEQRKRALR